VPIDHFLRGYRTTVLAPGRTAHRRAHPAAARGETFRLFKVSRRKDLDISSFGAAVWMRQTNGASTTSASSTAASGRWSCGCDAEDVLRGHAPTLERFEGAGRVAPRGDADHRRARVGGVPPHVAANILLKFWHEAVADGGGEGSGQRARPRAADSAPRGAASRPRVAGE
jgi:xanthine dehydrogenase small subunit